MATHDREIEIMGSVDVQILTNEKMAMDIYKFDKKKIINKKITHTPLKTAAY